MNFAAELQQIKGIGPIRGKRLFDAGFDSYRKILLAGEAQLKNVRGMGKTAVTILLGQAKQVAALDEERLDDASAPQQQPRTFHPFTSRKAQAKSPSSRKRSPVSAGKSGTGDKASIPNEASVQQEGAPPPQAAIPQEAAVSQEAAAPTGATATQSPAVKPGPRKRSTVQKRASAGKQAPARRQASSANPAPVATRASTATRASVPKQAALPKQPSRLLEKTAPQLSLAPHPPCAQPQVPAPQQAHGMHLRLSQLQERIGNLAQSAHSRYNSQLDCKSGRKLSIEIATIETALLRMHESGAEWPVRTARALLKVEKRIEGLEDVSLKKFCKRFKKARKAVIKGLP